MSDNRNTNICAILGFVLAFVNVAVGVILIVAKHGGAILISAPITALVGLGLSITGVSKAKSTGEGKGLGIAGIVLNALILIGMVLFGLLLLVFIQACKGMFEGIFEAI